MDTSIKHPTSETLRSFWKQGRKVVRPENWGVCCETVSPKNVRIYTHKISLTWLSRHELIRHKVIDKLMEKVKAHEASTLKNYR